MKKVKLVLLSFITLLMSSCSNNKEKEKVELMFGRIFESGIQKEYYFNDISANALDNYKQNPNVDTFLLYYYDETCSACNDFKPILNQAILDYKLNVYGLNSMNLSGNHEFIKDGLATPSLLLYKDGSLYNKYSFDSNEEYFTSSKGFESFIKDNIKLPNLYYISENYYNNLVSNNEEFVVLFSNYTCGYCKETSKRFLKDYLRKLDENKTFYLVDKNEVLENINEDEKLTYWNNFKLVNGFLDHYEDGSTNPFGLDTGFTPTFQYRKGNNILDAAHPFATFDSSINEVVRQFYQDDIAPIGSKFESSTAYKEFTASFYMNKLKEFLDSHL